jgi:acetyl esterase/lipase
MPVVFRCIVLALLGASAFGQAQESEETPAAPPLSFLHGSGTAIADEKNAPVVLRGCNLGNWLLIEPWMLGIFDLRDQAQVERALTDRFGADEKDRLLELYRENWMTPRDFQVIKSWHFNLVRLPFNCNLLEDEARPGQLKPDAFHWLDRAVDMAQKAGLYVILDLHGAPGGQSLDGVTGQAGRNQFWKPENRKRGAFIWQKIAGHFRDNPTIAAYDLLNEPFGMMNSDNHDADLVGAMEELIQAIREVDDRHLIFCAGSFRGIEMYSPKVGDWKNIGITEHFYPGVYAGAPTLETHARFINTNLAGRVRLLKKWSVPYLAGEFNVVFDRAGGAEMMRRYFDEFEKGGWAATLWSYKILKREGGVQPDHWYMVTNKEPLKPPQFSTDSGEELSAFFRGLSSIDYAQANDLRDALTAESPRPFPLGQYSPIMLPDKLIGLKDWADLDVGDSFPKGGHTSVQGGAQIFGGGRDIYEGKDEFHFVARSVKGPFNLTADVTRPTDTNAFAKAGLMFRLSPAANSPFVMVNLFPSGKCSFAYRQKPGERITEEQLHFDPEATALRLARRDGVFQATAFNSAGKELSTKSVELPAFAAQGTVGFFVLSHDAMLLSQARFSNIRFETANLPRLAQSQPVQGMKMAYEFLPASSPYGEARVRRNIPYLPNPSPHQNFDLYLPKVASDRPFPFILWIHGGAWMMSDKQWNNVKYLVQQGYAIASIDYRLSTEAGFPAQIQDCNAALNFILAHAAEFNIDSRRFVVGGASAGAHLALLLGLARSEDDFGAASSVRPLAILDFFGPADLAAIVNQLKANRSEKGLATMREASNKLLGAAIEQVPDKAMIASPVTYVRADSPPVLILHGGKDDLVPIAQSLHLHEVLKRTGAQSEFISLDMAGHDGPMFSTPEIQPKVIAFLKQAFTRATGP